METPQRRLVTAVDEVRVELARQLAAVSVFEESPQSATAIEEQSRRIAIPAEDRATLELIAGPLVRSGLAHDLLQPFVVGGRRFALTGRLANVSYHGDMIGFSAWPLWAHIAIFAVAASVIAWTGTKLAALGDQIADRTGLGEALTGTVFVGLTTALPGLAASVTAALGGHAALAISNAVGGIAVQTTFLAVADIVHTKANLEHAAASLANMIQTALLVILMVLVLLGLTGPDLAIFHVNPVTPLLLLAAGFGLWLAFRSTSEPMWQPKLTPQTVEDVPEQAHLRANLAKLIAGYVATAMTVTAAGAVVALATGNIAAKTRLNETVAGGLLSGVATSLPELVTTVAAVRRGALTLAVSDIVGGNLFDVLFVVAADVAYLQGSLYHGAGVGPREEFLTTLAVLMNAVLLLGLLCRQRRGPGNIGFESVLILAIYLGGFLILGFAM